MQRERKRSDLENGRVKVGDREKGGKRVREKVRNREWGERKKSERERRGERKTER